MTCYNDLMIDVHVYWFNDRYTSVNVYLFNEIKTLFTDWIAIIFIYTHRYSLCTDLMLHMHVYTCTHRQTGAAEILCIGW